MKPVTSKYVIILIGLLIMIPLFVSASVSARVSEQAGATLPHKTGTQWYPYLEWSLTNASYSGNPFDLVATVTFTHTASGETRTTEMFYDGSDTWKFRFSGTQSGDWTFTTSSSDGDLDGYSGTLTINPNSNSLGFVTHYENKWIRSGTNQAFVPQFVMVSAPHNYENDPGRVDDEIQTFLVEHGFNGMHTPVFCRWFDINERDCDDINDSSPNPDPRTFAALELLITKTYEADGVVHIWLWGDDARGQNPNFLPGGINGDVDRRLQRYIAARLGPIPGWTMGYGFDLFEWVSGDQLTEWHDYMQAHMGWKHYLGARADKNQLNQLSEAMDYSSYEQHRPDYDKYVETIEKRPQKPSFSEDRFRLRNSHPDKDYDMEMTRRGLWHSMMAGGVANIWGNLTGSMDANDGSETSSPYPNPEWIRTYAEFVDGRFFPDMERCNTLTDGVCLKRPNNVDYLFYAEDASSIDLDLSGMSGVQTAVAVDTAAPYNEISLGQLSVTDQTWSAPYHSDWAIAVGTFTQPACVHTTVKNMLFSGIVKEQNGPYNVFLPLIMNEYCP